MADFRTIAIRLLAANGKIDSHEIKLLKKMIVTEGKVSQEDLSFLADVRVALYKKAKKANNKYDAFFLKCLQDSMLGNGPIGAAELAKLGETIADGTIKKSAKKKLLDGLKKKSESVPSEFDGLYEQIKK